MADKINPLLFGLGPEGIKPGSLKTITDSKLASFAVGQQKKSRFQKAREEAEAKKKEEELAAAKVYGEFVASFTTEDDSKTFVRGSGGGTTASRGSGGGGELYKLESKKPKTEMERMLEEMKERDVERTNKQGGGGRDRPGGSSSSGGPRKERQIDDFLNEMKSRDVSGSSTSSVISGFSSGPIVTDPNAAGSFDNGDPNTTNLYIGNLSPGIYHVHVSFLHARFTLILCSLKYCAAVNKLPPLIVTLLITPVYPLETTEEMMMDLFGKYGEINSVKIMWPRTDEVNIHDSLKTYFHLWQ